MQIKQSPIPPELRPEVAGSKLESTGHTNSDIGTEKLDQMLESDEDLIIIIGSSDDGTYKYFSDYCISQGESVINVNLKNFREIKIICKYIEKNLENSAVKIFFRYAESIESRHLGMIAYLADLLSTVKGGVINRPVNTSHNISKPLQISFLSEYIPEGIIVPHTYILNGKKMDKSVIKNSIIKSISSIRSTVSSASVVGNVNSKKLFDCPIMLQKRISGINIRIHVIGDQLISYRIITNKLDYRIDGNIKIESVEIPNFICEWCLVASKAEGLKFAGFDFMVTKEEKWCLFEVNPTPAYHFYEKIAIKSGNSAQISNAILKALKEGAVFVIT